MPLEYAYHIKNTITVKSSSSKDYMYMPLEGIFDLIIASCSTNSHAISTVLVFFSEN